MIPDGDNIPSELTERDQWVCWAEETRDGKTTKIPKKPDGTGNAKSNDMATWGTFEQAVETAREHDGWGVGYMFSEADPYLGIDIDGGIRTDTERPRPESWLPKLDAFSDTYCEISPSGEGLHVILKDTRIPDWWVNQVRHLDKDPGFFETLDAESDHDEIEVAIYEHGRYFTFTGTELPNFGTNTVTDVPELYQWLTAAWLVFNDTVPGPEGDSKGGDIDVNVYDVLSRSEYPEGDRLEHPVHGSSTGANFMVDRGGETWRCWSGAHQCTGDAIHLVGMMEGLIECGQWVNSSISSETWTKIFDAARDRGLIEDDRKHLSEYGDSEPPEEPSDPPDVESEPVEFWNDIRSRYRFAENTNDKQATRHTAAKFLDRNRPFAAHEESDTLYVYNPSNGTYEPRGEAYIKRTLVMNLNYHYTRHENNEITDQLRGMNYKRPEEFGGPEGKINVANGVLDLQARELFDHDPAFMFLSSMPVEYEPGATADRWVEFLGEVVPMEIDRMKIQEYVGYCLMHWDLTLHKALFIVGPTASGKSTFLDTVRALLGPDTVSSITPQELVDERFAAVELFGAWANIRNDIPAGVIENTGKFKELVAGDPIKAERKYEPTFTFSPKAKHLYSANHLPEASVDDDAFYRRIMLVSFPSTIPINDRDPDLPKKLQQELPGILNWAIEGYQRLIDEGGFTGARSPGKVRETWESWGSTVERFKQECLEKEAGHFIPKSLCHKAYVKYCEENGLPAAVTQNQMTRKFKQDSEISDGRRTYKGSRTRCYIGVQLKDEHDTEGVNPNTNLGSLEENDDTDNDDDDNAGDPDFGTTTDE